MSETTAVASQTSRPRARALTRRRRENAPGGRRHRHSVLVTPEEEGVLVRLAAEQGVTVPRLLVEAATAEPAGETASDRRELLTELFGVHRALGAVGNNLNQLTRAANATGDLAVELEHTLAAVRRQLVRLDDTLDGLAP
ncbi:hypothetical protein GCM10022204_27030 [Microlunatus aurantiacus]|uniref:Bacterial mobilisation domain-containing protein n=1 Tax=Microlunatus aurantiacus TaxID=446786 RepID=A0ABP7DQH8_9ACTN